MNQEKELAKLHIVNSMKITALLSILTPEQKEAYRKRITELRNIAFEKELSLSSEDWKEIDDMIGL